MTYNERTIQRILRIRYIDDGHWLHLYQPKGRPNIYYMGRKWLLSRLILALTDPNWDDKLWALHKCRCERCFNPEHLYSGTPSQNMIDYFYKHT